MNKKLCLSNTNDMQTLLTELVYYNSTVECVKDDGEN